MLHHVFEVQSQAHAKRDLPCTCKDPGNDGSLLVGRNGAVLW